LGDYGGVGGSINFGLTNTQYIIDVNNTVYRIEGNLSELNLTNVNVLVNDINATVYTIRGSIAELNDTLLDVNLTVTNINLTLADINLTISDVNSTLGDINSTLSDMNSTLDDISSQGDTSNNLFSQVTQILGDIYGVLWSGANVTERYHVLVDDNSNFTAPEINRRVADSNLTIDQARYLTNNTVYYFKVRVIEDGGYGVWSEINQFTAAFD